MDRNDVVALILEARKAKGLTWAELAAKVGKSKEWVAAGCLGQMTFSAEQARALMEVLGLPAERGVHGFGLISRDAGSRNLRRLKYSGR
jgi:cyanate lyase